MSYTKYIEFMQKCNYMNPETQNANVMLNGCINDVTKDIKYVEPNKYHNMDSNPIDKEYKEDKGVEGYTNGPFYTDNGPGKSFLKNKCPDGFAFCNNKNMCKKICNNCSTEKYYKHLYNSCLIGNYNGIDNRGNAYCAVNSNDLGINNIQNPFIF